MYRKDQYKQGASYGADAVREKTRGQELDKRKLKKEKLINSKRIRLEEVTANESQHVDYTTEQVKDLSKSLQVRPSGDRLSLLKTLKNMLAQGSHMVEAFLSVDNSLRCLVGILTGSDPALQLEAAWCITNISASTHEHCMLALKYAAPYLITYLSGQNTALQDQCCWALGNLAGDGPECRDTLLAQGALQPMVNLLESAVPSVVLSAAFALSNVARGTGANTRSIIDAGAAPRLIHLLGNHGDNMELLSEMAWVLMNIIASGEHDMLLISLGIIPNLVSNIVNLASNELLNTNAITPLVRCLGNICSGTADDCTTIATQDGCLLPAIGRLLQCEHRHVHKETLWALSNMIDNESVCKQITQCDILTHIVYHLSSSFAIKKEALICLGNLAYQGPVYCQDILQQHPGLFRDVITMLKSPDLDSVLLAVGFVEMILRQTDKGTFVFEEYDGVASLDELGYHGNQTIQKRASELVETYFHRDR